MFKIKWDKEINGILLTDKTNDEMKNLFSFKFKEKAFPLLMTLMTTYNSNKPFSIS